MLEQRTGNTCLTAAVSLSSASINCWALFHPSMEQFRPGSIRQLTLKNFQVFRNATFKFGPSLNLIAAPNGSGKSAIGNGIVLLFGSSRILGTARIPGEFVHFGEGEAVITALVATTPELTLTTNSNRSSPDILLERRIIIVDDDKTSKSVFLVNGTVYRKKDFDKVVSELGINVASPCNFLPQERVAEFCQLNPSVLLSGLLENSCSKNLEIPNLEVLYSKREKTGNLTKKIEELETRRELLEKSMVNMQVDLEKERKRELLIEKLMKLRYRKEYIKYEKAAEEYKVVKEELREEQEKMVEFQTKKQAKEDEMKKLEENPALKKYNENVKLLENQNQQLRERQESLKSQFTKLELEASKIEALSSKLETVRSEAKRAICNIKEGEDRIESINKELGEIIQGVKKSVVEYENANNSEEMKKNMDVLDNLDSVYGNEWNMKLKEIDRIVAGVSMGNEYNDNRLRQMQFIAQQHQRAIGELQEKEISYSKQDAARLELLQKYHSDTHKAVIWLRNNKSIFKGEILEPAFLHLELEKTYQEELEALLGFQSLSSFLVSNPDDFLLFSKILKEEQKLTINIAEVVKQRSNSELSRSMLKEYGFDGVASDFITARAEYIDFLNAYGYFNTVPLSKSDVNEAEFFMRETRCRRMIVAGRFVEIKNSKYSKDFIISTSPIYSKGLFKFPKIEIEDVKNRLLKLKEEREDMRVEMERLYREKEAFEKKREAWKRKVDLTEARSKVYQIEEIKRRMKDEMEKIENVKRIRNKVEDAKGNYNEVSRKIDCLTAEVTAILSPELIPEMNINEMKSAKLDLENAKREIICIEQQMKEATCLIKMLEDEKNMHKGDVVKHKEKLRKMFETHEKYNLTQCDEDLNEIEDIETEISLLKAKLARMSDGSLVRTEFVSREAQLESTLIDIRTLREKKRLYEHEFGKMRNEWIEKINSVILPVNQSFSAMLRRFGATGRLELCSGDGPWGLNVYVAFRENEVPERLCGFRQSGGEKSLCTALFLLSLQKSATVPFRLVDEINQGMDAVNERLVFEIIKELSMSSQFFIITPKLVPGLVFPESAQTTLIYAGPGITPFLSEYAARVLSS